MGRGSPSLWRVLAIVGLYAMSVQAGYISVNMTIPTQCNNATLQWSGDDGPYHILLTPTDFVRHGYNVWIPSVPDDQTMYKLLLRYPAGMPFMATVWGASGIEYAGSSDIMTVGNSNDSSCFLTDQQILDLYTFSFNITDPTEGYPPQCTNLSMSWPTSLESNVTGTLDRRSMELDLERDNEADVAAMNVGRDVMGDVDISRLIAPLRELGERDPSSSNDTGNTTNPPSIFGLIPLGNSFNIPITYSSKSRFASTLPATSISDTPTTYTLHGTTYLNWTIQLAKGTRFILVAGIGSAEQWASGGSSKLLTVGQGDTSCVGQSDSPIAAPSVTASETSGPIPTDSVPEASTSPSIAPGPSLTTRIIIACVISVVGTLLIVGLLYIIRRVRRRRREAAARAVTFPSGKTGRIEPFDPALRSGDLSPALDTQLDLIASRSRDDRTLRRLVLDPGVLGERDRDTLAGDANDGLPSPASSSDPFRSPQETYAYPFSGGSQGHGQDAYVESPGPISPTRGQVPFGSGLAGTPNIMGRQPSAEALLAGHGLPYFSNTNTNTTNSTSRDQSSPSSPVSGFGSTYPSLSSRGRLALHDAFNSTIDDAGTYEEDIDMPDLKRDTLAYLDRDPTAASATASASRTGMGPSSRLRGASADQLGPAGQRGPGTMRYGQSGMGMGNIPGERRRRRTEMDGFGGETEYVLHRDAGRAVMELPPRYDEVNWEGEGGGGAEEGTGTVGSRSTNTTDMGTGTTATGMGIGTGRTDENRRI